MSWYMLPAAVAFIVKLWFLFALKSQTRTLIGRRWFGFVAIFCMHNLAELLLYSSAIQDGLATEFLLRCYYACTSLIVIYCFVYVMNEKQFYWQKVLFFIISTFCALVLSLLFFTNLIISGYLEWSYTFTAIKGSYYFVFQVFAVLGMLGMSGALIYNFMKSQSEKERAHYCYALIGLTPLVMACFGVISLMLLGYKVNAAMLLPIASTIFLMITLKGKMSDPAESAFLSFVPFTLEYQLRKQVKLAQLNYINKSNSHQETMMTIEKALLEYQRDKHDGSVAKASKTIGIMRSTFYSKMNRLNKN